MGNALKKDKGRATTPGGRTVRLTKGKSEADVETFDAEQLEQLGMLSSYEEGEILKIFKRFRRATEGEEFMTEDQFREMPEIAMNPLIDRLVVMFGFNKPGNEEGINFSMFVISLSVFSHRGTRAKKLRAAFDLYDVDGDGKISRDDLMMILSDIVEFSGEARDEQEKLLRQVVDLTFEECSARGKFITFEGFRQVAQQVDFESKINIALKL